MKESPLAFPLSQQHCWDLYLWAVEVGRNWLQLKKDSWPGLVVIPLGNRLWGFLVKTASSLVHSNTRSALMWLNPTQLVGIPRAVAGVLFPGLVSRTFQFTLHTTFQVKVSGMFLSFCSCIPKLSIATPLCLHVCKSYFLLDSIKCYWWSTRKSPH